MYILKTIFDWIFPPSEEVLRVRQLDTAVIEQLYHHQFFENIITLSSFKNTDIRALIHEAKFHNNAKAHKLLNVLMAQYVNQSKNHYDLIVPIPLSQKRKRGRGYNQVVSILTSSELGVPTETNVLSRIKHTQPQTDLPKDKRKENMRDAFGVTHPEIIKNKRILLVDDVVTTGATLNAAKAVLLPHNPTSITCLALAH